MAESPNGEETGRRETSRSNEYFQGNYQAGLVVPPQYFTQHMYYPYVNPYSHLTESGGNLSIHGYGSDGRPKFRRSRTIFSPEQIEILEEQFTKYKYPDVKRRHSIAEEVGLSDERVQVWFQNRRAKNKRQTDQQVKLQKLVDEAIGTSTGNQQQYLEKSEKTGQEGRVSANMGHQSTSKFQHNPFDQQLGEDHVKIKIDNERSYTEPPAKIPQIKEPENPQEDVTGSTSRDNLLGHGRPLGTRVDNPENTHNVVWQAQTSAPSTSYSSTDAQVVIQNIDQELLFQVANILSASNDASMLITEWSQAPNKTQTNNLEEQLRHFANHHHQVLHNCGQNTTENHQKQSNNTPSSPQSN